MATTHLQRETSGYYSQSQKASLPVNIDWPERIASIMAGVRLVSGGIKKLVKHPVRNSVLTMAGGYLVYRGLTGNCPLYASLGRRSTKNVNVNIKEMFTVNKPRHEVYQFWRRLENLPLFMTHLERVEETSEKRSHWEAKLPGTSAKISWDAEIVEDKDNSMISWKSMPGSTIDNAGKVEFNEADNGQGTELHVVISYCPPAGGIGTGVAKLLNPVFEKMVRSDLNNFKNYIESAVSATPTAYEQGSGFSESAVL